MFAEYPRTVIAKPGCVMAIAVPLILTLNSVLTTSDRASDRFIKKNIALTVCPRLRQSLTGVGGRGGG